MWHVEFESPKVKGQVRLMMQRGELSKEDRRLIRIWILQMTYHGPESIAKDKNWCDHALEENWWGYRSSTFSHRGRIIYRVIENKVLVQIVRITNSHDYRR